MMHTRHYERPELRYLESMDDVMFQFSLYPYVIIPQLDWQGWHGWQRRAEKGHQLRHDWSALSNLQNKIDQEVLKYPRSAQTRKLGTEFREIPFVVFQGCLRVL
jgi:hypothetical protein